MARGKSQGIQSRNNKEVGVRTHSSVGRAKGPGGVAQLGQRVGNHITNKRGSSDYVGDRFEIGQAYNSGVELGNRVALNVKGGGPGKGYVQYGQSGSQCQYGKANPGNPTPVKKTQLEDFGPDYQRKGRFG